MSPARFAAGGPDGGAVAALRAELVARGWTDAADGASALEVAVYLDRPHPAGSIGTTAPRAWIDELGRGLGHAFGFLRDARARMLGGSGGLLVVETSAAGAVGVPGRSLDSAVSAGLVGLARSLSVETLSLSVACLSLTLPAPATPWTSADVAWPLPGPPADREELAATADAVTALPGSIVRPGTFITVTVDG